MTVQPFESNYRVRGYDCNYGGPLKPLALADFFQETAGDHATHLGLGMDAMFSRGHTWMLSRIDIEIEDLPREGDEVMVRTWPDGTERIFAIRYLELLAADGRRLAGALYDYYIVDVEKRRLLRPEKILDPSVKVDRPAPYPDLSPDLQDIRGFGKELTDDWKETSRLTVGPRHLDNNGHVNNAHFVDWLCDAIPLAERGSGSLARLKVDFRAEVKAGEEIRSYWTDDASSSAKLAVLARNGEVVARALTRWR